MILNAAGHGGLVNPLTFGEGRRKLPGWAWAAIGCSVAVHVAGGAWLYHQRVQVPPADAPTVDKRPPIELLRLERREPEPAQAPERRQEPTRKIRSTPIPPPDVPLSPVPENPLGGEAGPVSMDPPQAPVPAASGDSGPGPAAAAGPAKITKPQWLQRPTAAQMERHYPRAGLSNDATGSAMIRCAVTVSGNVTACSVISEDPAGQGFGSAALKLSRYFRMSPKTIDGQPVDGAIVDIRLAFTLD